MLHSIRQKIKEERRLDLQGSGHLDIGKTGKGTIDGIFDICEFDTTASMELIPSLVLREARTLRTKQLFGFGVTVVTVLVVQHRHPHPRQQHGAGGRPCRINLAVIKLEG
jgi:hypothetical protein